MHNKYINLESLSLSHTRLQTIDDRKYAFDKKGRKEMLKRDLEGREQKEAVQVVCNCSQNLSCNLMYIP